MAGVFLTLFHNHQAMLNNGYHNCTRRFRVSGGLFPILVPDKQPTNVVWVYYTISHPSLVLDFYGHEWLEHGSYRKKGRDPNWKPEYLAALRHIFSEMWRELGYADNRVHGRRDRERTYHVDDWWKWLICMLHDLDFNEDMLRRFLKRRIENCESYRIESMIFGGMLKYAAQQYSLLYRLTI